MKAASAVLEYLIKGGVKYLFGIPAGSVNAIFDALYDRAEITPVIAKHEGAASYMAAAYAKHANKLAVCIGCSGPGSTNLITGAANAQREHLPVLFITGHVPLRTVGLNASQELNAAPLFTPVTKYSTTVQRPEDVLPELHKAVTLALSGVPGPVHIALPIDIQLTDIGLLNLPLFPKQQRMIPDASIVKQAAELIHSVDKGIILIGQGVRQAIEPVLQLAEWLHWPILTTPQAKGFIPSAHPLSGGVFGFAGQAYASNIIEDPTNELILVIGSSLGETATSNWNDKLVQQRRLIQIDIDASVFDRVYQTDISILGEAGLSLQFLIHELEQLSESANSLSKHDHHCKASANIEAEFNTQNVLLELQNQLPLQTKYTVDIGEFMSYVIHYMEVKTIDSFDINVHFGAMGTAIGSAIGWQLAEPNETVVCITGDGCFFMHGMEILCAKEYNLPILFVVMNNSRLGMVYHGHTLQYQRSHACFEQQQTDIARMVDSMGIPSLRISSLNDMVHLDLESLIHGTQGPKLLEIELVDNNVPPMGDRVKFLSSFQK